MQCSCVKGTSKAFYTQNVHIHWELRKKQPGEGWSPHIHKKGKDGKVMQYKSITDCKIKSDYIFVVVLFMYTWIGCLNGTVKTNYSVNKNILIRSAQLGLSWSFKKMLNIVVSIVFPITKNIDRVCLFHEPTSICSSPNSSHGKAQTYILSAPGCLHPLFEYIYFLLLRFLWTIRYLIHPCFLFFLYWHNTQKWPFLATTPDSPPTSSFSISLPLAFTEA